MGTVCTRFSLHRDQIPYKNFPLPLSDPLPHGEHGDLQEATVLLAPPSSAFASATLAR